jgi:hypothetical protein
MIWEVGVNVVQEAVFRADSTTHTTNTKALYCSETSLHTYETIPLSNPEELYTVTCRAVAMQRPGDGRIYQGRFWATAR